MKLLSLSTVVAGLMLFAGMVVPAYAQTSPEIVIRQGDSIQWVASSGTHKVNFGATGTTPVADINTILTFTPALVPNPTAPGQSESKATSGTLQVATVKEDKGTIGKTFVFTCGFHPTAMISLAFRVAPKDPAQPVRTYRVMGEAPGQGVFNWHLHVDTTQ